MDWIISGKCKSKVQLDGKTALITGANTGIGKFTAIDLARRGANVIIACRDLDKAEKAAEEIRLGARGIVVVYKLDLSSFQSVREFCKQVLENHNAIHLLINNAGVMMCPKSLSSDGYELQFATNHLGHFLLTLLLLPMIRKSKPARIINVSSLAHKYCRSMHFNDINLDKSYNPISAYCRSKLANILFSKELAKRLEGSGVNVYSLHPGVVNTELTRHIDSMLFWGANWLYSTFGWLFIKSPEQGAQTTLYCALDETAGKESGLYYDNCKVASPSRLANDVELAKELWDKSIVMVGLTTFNPFE